MRSSWSSNTQEAHGMITMQGQVRPGADVRPVGQDITRGQRVLEVGSFVLD